jgi:hypothetical protein
MALQKDQMAETVAFARTTHAVRNLDTAMRVKPMDCREVMGKC